MRIKVTKMMQTHIHNTGILDLDYLNPNPSPDPGIFLPKICKQLTVSGSRPKDLTRSGYTTLPNIPGTCIARDWILATGFYPLISQCFSGEHLGSLLAEQNEWSKREEYF
jgi:hypothetical protein